MRVLVIEDSAPTRDLLVRSLQDAGLTVVTAARKATGLRQAMTTDYDVIVLDLMLPDGDGLDLCRELRAAGITTPVLCLTARADVSDRVRGLDAGADDYLRKPFALAELQARIRALGRRGGHGPTPLLEAGGLRIDFAARRLFLAGIETPMTAREWALLEILAAREGKVVGRVEILELIWREATASTSASLDVIVGRLRRKLGEDPDGYVIRTIRGEGYCLERRP
jgi:two-component system OmpR family response regulator